MALGPHFAHLWLSETVRGSLCDSWDLDESLSSMTCKYLNITSAPLSVVNDRILRLASV